MCVCGVGVCEWESVCVCVSERVRECVYVSERERVCVCIHCCTYTHIRTLFDTRCRGCFRHCSRSRKVTGSIPDVVIGILFVIDIILWHPGSRLNLWRNRVPGICPFGRPVRRFWQSYLLHIASVLHSGNVVLLEHSGPVQILLYRYVVQWVGSAASWKLTFWRRNYFFF